MLLYVIGGCLFWGAIALVVYCLRGGSPLQADGLALTGRRRALVLAVLAATVLICVLPMFLSPVRLSGEPDFLMQYERMAESLRDGRLWLDCGEIDPALLQMADPYDRAAREALGVHYRWDHAFYNGRYYMYFGIVPVLLLFLPYLLLTGASLPTYVATQLFTALFICGLFALFYMLAWQFFRRMSLGLYLSLAAAFSMMSTWYIADAPYLYCTAIVSGMCMEIWSLCFFFQVVWGGQSPSLGALYALLGGLTGALAFGCRPPVALANVLLLPMLAVYLKKKRPARQRAGQLAAAAVPYVVVGALLMVYNYVRFDSPFEFGQSYQLTVTDQSQYGSILSRFSLKQGWEFLRMFLSLPMFHASFPFISHSGIFFNFPIIAVAGLCLFRRDVFRLLRERGLFSLTVGLIAAVGLIAGLDALCSPYMLERYRSDVYWLLGLLSFILLGALHQALPEGRRSRAACWICWLAVFTAFTCFLHWCVPYDGHFGEVFPDKLALIGHVVCFGLL